MAYEAVTKVSSANAEVGGEGERCLGTGKSLAMRMWVNEEPGKKPPSRRDYETVGYVLQGRAELIMGEQVVELAEGDSYVVPQGVEHAYNILESFSSIEATHPPAKCPV